MPDPDPIMPAPPPVPSPPPGLINTAPGLANTTPGTPPSGAPASGAPVTGYTPAQAQASTATSTSYDPKAFTVGNNQTVAGQIKGLIDQGSPLLEMAEANARKQMNARGLINSTQAVTAGQKALYEAALPIASADAATYDRAAANTTTAENRALEFDATAQNNASLANAQLTTQNEQFNAGQTNAALDKAATASNQVALTAQQIQGTKDVQEMQGLVQKQIANIQADNNLTLADKQAATQQVIAGIQANTELSKADKAAATQQAIAAQDAAVRAQIAQLQADTALTQQEKAAQAEQALAQINGTIQQQIERVRADTSLSIADKQAEINKYTAMLQSNTAKDVQRLQNEGALANIKANGEINTRITALQDKNKLLLQTSSGASQLYTQALQSMSAIMSNMTMNGEQKQVALNNQVQQLSDALDAMTAIAGTPTIQSTLTFDSGPNASSTSLPPPPDNEAARRTQAIQSLYSTVLGRAADQAGLDYWVNSGMSPAQIEASMRESNEYRARNPG